MRSLSEEFLDYYIAAKILSYVIAVEIRLLVK